MPVFLPYGNWGIIFFSSFSLDKKSIVLRSNTQRETHILRNMYLRISVEINYAREYCEKPCQRAAEWSLNWAKLFIFCPVVSFVAQFTLYSLSTVSYVSYVWKVLYKSCLPGGLFNQTCALIVKITCTRHATTRFIRVVAEFILTYAVVRKNALKTWISYPGLKVLFWKVNTTKRELCCWVSIAYPSKVFSKMQGRVVCKKFKLLSGEKRRI